MSESASGEATGSSTAADKEFSCPECGKGYTTSNGLRYHLKGDGCSGYECPTCGDDSFYLKSGMEQHHAVVHSESLNKVKTECGYCGVVLKRHPSHLEQGDNVFCSDDCENDYKSEHMSGENGPSWKGGKVTVSCVICGEEKKVHPWQKEQHDRSFCSPECRGEWMKEAYKGEKGPNWKGGWDYHYGHNWDEQREKALERDNHTCQYCGKDESDIRRSLDVHHIKPLREFKNDELENTFERGNALSNLISACPTCHAKWEGVPLKPILS